MSEKKEDKSSRKDNRYRLNDDEIKIIEQFRENGTLPDSANVVSDINKAKNVDKLNELKGRYTSSIEEINQLNNQISTLIDLRNTTLKPYRIAPSHSKKDSSSTIVFIASDWHLEETIEASTVNNLNEFNLEIAEERAKKFFQKSLLMYNLLSENFNIKTCVLGLLGDFINGYIHEELIEENSLSPTQALLLTKRLLISGIDFLLENTDFDEMIIPCCYGNHARTTAKSRISTGYKNSFEWLMYKDLETHYSKNKNIKFVVANAYHAFVNLYDKYLIRFHHGDAIRFAGGVGGLTIPVNKAIAQWNKSIPANLDVFGHWHQSIDGGNFVSNGSLVGYNPYATFIKAPFEIPQQSMFVINEEYGKILSAPIFLT